MTTVADVPAQATAHQPIALDADLSKRIRIIRVICIFFMMYVHVNPGLGSHEVVGILGWAKYLLVDLLGRASVSALSLISGVLIVYELTRKPYRTAIATRVKTLVLPLLTWNVVILVVSLLIFTATKQQTDTYRNIQGTSALSLIVGKLLAVDANGATTALNFLRDVFACALLSPGLIWASKRLGIAFVVGVWLIGLLHGFEPVVYRASILMFYTLGVYAAVRHARLRFQLWHGLAALAVLVAVAYCSSIPGLALAEVPQLNGTLNVLKRLCLTLGVFLAAQAILKHDTIARRFVQVEPRIYFIFLGHTVFFLCCWGVWQMAFGKSLQFPYILFYVLLPVAWVLCSRYAMAIVSLMPRAAQIALRGK